MLYLLGGLALAQAIAQLVWFLHLGHESAPRWKLVAFAFMLLVLVILIVGSIWIMNNLNYHTMSPADTTTFIIHDEGIKP
jgi:cytochrome o ubiquinol oxidase operon protein cyoD